MNFFKLYIGDYQRDTAHLSVTEHGAFLLMLQTYYATEKPLPTGKALHRMLRAQDKAERDAIDSVVGQFWTVTDAGLVNERADQEIAKANAQADTNARIAREREAKRKAARDKDEQSTNRATNGSPNHSQTPDKNTHTTGAADSDGLSDYHATTWQPDPKRLQAYLRSAGIPMPTDADLSNSLTRFNLHYADKPMTENQRYGKLVSWLTGDHRHARPAPAVVTAAERPAATRKLTPVEQVRAAQERELGKLASGG